jgi:hypothetical protein
MSSSSRQSCGDHTASSRALFGLPEGHIRDTPDYPGALRRVSRAHETSTEKVMSAKAIDTRRPVLALALGLSLATIVALAALARADHAANFVCQAKPGGWCDLRDWNGFDKAF